MVRHGLMLVGSTYASKSCCIKVLAEAQTMLKGQTLGSTLFEKTRPIYINPKSVKSTICDWEWVTLNYTQSSDSTSSLKPPLVCQLGLIKVVSFARAIYGPIGDIFTQGWNKLEKIHDLENLGESDRNTEKTLYLKLNSSQIGTKSLKFEGNPRFFRR